MFIFPRSKSSDVADNAQKTSYDTTQLEAHKSVEVRRYFASQNLNGFKEWVTKKGIKTITHVPTIYKYGVNEEGGPCWVNRGESIMLGKNESDYLEPVPKVGLFTH